MICPFCREKDTSVVDSRPTEDGTAIRRRRVCTCGGGQRFTTFERVQFRELTVIKKNGRRQWIVTIRYINCIIIQSRTQRSLRRPMMVRLSLKRERGRSALEDWEW